jgi:hypothetical protein
MIDISLHNRTQIITDSVYWCTGHCIIESKYLLQFLNGFPVNPFGQKHIGFPLSISHFAFMPHGFGSQGLLGPKRNILNKIIHYIMNNIIIISCLNEKTTVVSYSWSLI